jgi:hypothetical protein
VDLPPDVMPKNIILQVFESMSAKKDAMPKNKP